MERIPQGPIYAKDILLASWIFANVYGDDVDDDDDVDNDDDDDNDDNDDDDDDAEAK